MVRLSRNFQPKQAFISALATFILVCLCITPALAEPKKGCPKAKGPKPVGAVNSSNGSVYEKGQFGMIQKYTYIHQDQLFEGGDEVDYKRLAKGQKGKKCYERTSHMYQVTFRAGLLENIDARVVVPYMSKNMKRESATKHFNDNKSGIGDVKLLSRYRIMSQKQKDPLNLAFGLGIKMPTGTTDEHDSKGVCLPGYLQTGTGSWDPIFELGAHKVMGRHMVTSYFMYKLSTEGELGDKDFEAPDVFKYNAGYMYALSNLFDIGLELNGEYKTKTELDDDKVENSGGHIIFLTPEIHCKLTRNVHLDVGVPIAVYRDLNGTQLSEDYRVVTKLAMKF